MKILWIALFVLVKSVLANDCAPINLVTEPNSPFQKMPVYEQDGAGICYAYAASQLINYHLIKNGGEPSVHPLWVSVNYSEVEKQSALHSGYSKVAINFLKVVKNCPAAVVSKAIETWVIQSNASEAELMGMIDSTSDLISSKNLSPQQIDEAIEKSITDFAPFCSANPTWQSILPILRSLSVLSSQKLFEDLILPACKNNLVPLNIPDATSYSLTETQVVPTLNNRLNELKAPLSIMYCSNVLEDPSDAGIIDFQEQVLTKECGPHESIVVGQKEINNSCHFLIRNTWGTDFGKWTNNWNCLCKNIQTGELVDDCRKSTHNNGKFSIEGCWISGEALKKNTYRMITLETLEI
jgi:hypothetical protein